MVTSFVLSTPIGPIKLSATEESLLSIEFLNSSEKVSESTSAVSLPDHPVLQKAAKQLSEYFSGARKDFDLPLQPEGTDFQKRVWAELRAIPFGQTATYGEIAKSLGAPSASRAVGGANNRNPLPIVIPCHRVIGSNRQLVGFGGGLPVKKALLNLEGHQFSDSDAVAARP